MKKTCPICGKVIEDTDQRRRYCSDTCQKESKKQRAREYQRERRRDPVYLERMRQYNKKYYQEHKEQYTEYSRKYYHDHREQCIEKNRKYNRNHRDEKKEYMRLYKQNQRLSQRACAAAHDNCFSCPREDRDCPYD